MKRLNRKGYLTIEIILGATIAFAIAFFLMEITTKMVSDTEDTYRDTVVTTDSALIISGIKDNIENNKDGINKVKCTNNKCTISYNDKNTGVLVLNLDDKTIHYEMTKPGDSNKYDVYDRKLDSSLSDVTLSSSISGEVTIDSNIYFKISGKNIIIKMANIITVGV